MRLCFGERPLTLLSDHMQKSRGNRTGRNFTLRLSERQLAEIELARSGSAGPGGLGPWLVERALQQLKIVPALALPGSGPGNAKAGVRRYRTRGRKAASFRRSTGHCRAPEGMSQRVILDLCGGSGSWSRPYAEAGYIVRIMTLPDCDVRAVREVGQVWGVLAAPPCNEFSILKRGPRDFAAGLEIVIACLRIIAICNPVWWAMENPGSGLLRRWLGPPEDVWQPHEFGDPWTKLTALWGRFTRPNRRHCLSQSRMPGNDSASRAITPPGFARAFFEANP